MRVMETSSKGWFTAVLSAPGHCNRPLPTHTSAGDSWTLMGKSVSLLWGHCSFILGPGVHKVLFLPSKKESVPPSLCKFW